MPNAEHRYSELQSNVKSGLERALSTLENVVKHGLVIEPTIYAKASCAEEAYLLRLAHLVRREEERKKRLPVERVAEVFSDIKFDDACREKCLARADDAVRESVRQYPADEWDSIGSFYREIER